eukprot:SAG31_NODE_1622_length_7722_cov_4.332940_5_plen_536_part_00
MAASTAHDPLLHPRHAHGAAAKSRGLLVVTVCVVAVLCVTHVWHRGMAEGEPSKMQLVHPDDGVTSERASKIMESWDISHDTELEPQHGGALADKNGGFFDLVIQTNDAQTCALQASDVGLSMWVFKPHGRNAGGTCSVARRMPKGRHTAQGVVSGTTRWKPNFESLGMLSTAEWGVAESSALRFKGKMYVMESVSGKGTFESQNLRSAFRIRELETGKLVANVENANGHAFFVARVDHARGVVWVYGSARNRGINDEGACDSKAFDKNGNRCYVGAWHSTNMVEWSSTSKALTVPKGTYVANVAVAIVSGSKYDTSALPKHQAVMALEYCDNEHCEKSSRDNRYCFAINTGSDGDLGSNWKVLSNKYCSSGMHSCPSLNYDAEEGYYYMTGGGTRINGPDRSKDLIHWERSPLYPMSRPAIDLNHPFDGFASNLYSQLWKTAPGHSVAKSRLAEDRMFEWNWGHSDLDLCCNDDESPSYLVYISSPQSHGSTFKGENHAFTGIGKYHGTLTEWLRSYFPSKGSVFCGATDPHDC